FAVWDARSQTLFAARDRLGKKPFVYARTPRAFLFGSEIKAILAAGEVEIEPDFAAIEAYLTWQYVPSPQTAFKGICKLPPAHWLRCDASGNLELGRYWSTPHGVKRVVPAAEIERQLVSLLRDCVRSRMVA